MSGKAIIPLVAGLCIGGFALKFGIDTLKRARAAPAATVGVWAAKADIPRGTQITEEMVSQVAFPATLAPKGALKQKDQVVGRVPRVDAPAGLPVLEEMLLSPGQSPGVHVPPGYRAVAVKIDEGSGVDFHLEPGSHVDVVGYFTINRRNGQEVIARTLIEDVEVAAVGARLSAVLEPGTKKEERQTRAVTLLVKPDKVPMLHMAEQKGKIKLSMRGCQDSQQMGESNPISEEELLDPAAARAKRRQEQATSAGDESQVASSGVAAWLRGVFAKPEPKFEQKPAAALAATPAATAAPPVVAPALPPDPTWVVSVWRGNKLEVVRFKNRDSHERVAAPAPDKRGTASPASAVPQAPAPAPAPAQAQACSPSPATEEPVTATVSSDPQEEQEPQNQEPQEPSE